MPQRMGNRDPNAAPHGVYRCQGDDRWCAIAVQSADQWSAFCQAIGNPDWCGEDAFSTLESRLANQGRLDELVGEWTIGQAAEDAMTRLQEAGVPAGLVSQGQDLYEGPHLKAREFYRPTPFYLADRSKPAWEWEGMEGISSANPPKMTESPMDFGHYSNIGEDNDYVFKEILGMSKKEVDRLKENQSLF